MNYTTDQVLHELHNPNNFVEVEFCHPEIVIQDARDRITDEAETYRHQITLEEVEDMIDDLEADTALQAASMFLDWSADHGIYETVSITLKRYSKQPISITPP